MFFLSLTSSFDYYIILTRKLTYCNTIFYLVAKTSHKLLYQCAIRGAGLRIPDGTINIMLSKVLVSYLKNTLTQSFNASISFAPISSLTECIERSGIPISTVFTGRSVDAIEPSVPPPRTSDLFTNL